MKNEDAIYMDFVIDKLTNSIVNTISGDSFQTEISLLTKSDMKNITRKNGWKFNWNAEFQDIRKEVYKLTIVNHKYKHIRRPCLYESFGECFVQYRKKQTL